MTVRTATLRDLDAIMALERASFPTDAWSDAMMREELASRHSFYVVVEEAGRLVGYAGLRVARGASDADIQTIINVAQGGAGSSEVRFQHKILFASAAHFAQGNLGIQIHHLADKGHAFTHGNFNHGVILGSTHL